MFRKCIVICDENGYAPQSAAVTVMEMAKPHKVSDALSIVKAHFKGEKVCLIHQKIH